MNRHNVPKFSQATRISTSFSAPVLLLPRAETDSLLQNNTPTVNQSEIHM